MTHRVPFILTILVGVAVFLYFLTVYTLVPAGDIAEYFGVTQSLLSHGTIMLTSDDIVMLKPILHGEYFTDPGYYLYGRDGNRYPVHFIAYSFFLIPMRMVLTWFHFSPLLTFPLTNLCILFATLLFCMKRFFHSYTKQVFFPLLMLFSPILFFIVWPGPDLLVVCLITIALCFIWGKEYIPAGFLLAFASWQSQPLAPLACIGALLSLSQRRNVKRIALFLLTLGIVAVPYLYNLVIFGALTPWTLFQDTWTKTYGFGLQNISLKKLFEQFFDPNIGIFWYMPLGTIIGIGYLLWKGIKQRWYWGIGIFAVMTAFFFQTNPAWHYGTSGYGPTRHILFIVPLFAILSLEWIVSLKQKRVFITIVTLYFIIQSVPLTWNGWLTPQFDHALYQSPAAQYVLNTIPQWYNPTPEIFIDRTNHTDTDRLSTAVYTFDNKCKKAYIANGNIEPVLKICGYISSDAVTAIRTNPNIYTYSTYK